MNKRRRTGGEADVGDEDSELPTGDGGDDVAQDWWEDMFDGVIRGDQLEHEAPAARTPGFDEEYEFWLGDDCADEGRGDDAGGGGASPTAAFTATGCGGAFTGGEGDELAWTDAGGGDSAW